MMINTLPLFGFDLFGMRRKLPSTPVALKSSTSAGAQRAEDEVERRYREKDLEAFIWGMYPVY